MCQGYKNCYVYCTEYKNPFMDLRLSLAEVSKVTENLIINVGKEDETLQLTFTGCLRALHYLGLMRQVTGMTTG